MSSTPSVRIFGNSVRPISFVFEGSRDHSASLNASWFVQGRQPQERKRHRKTFAHLKSLHISLNTAYSGCKPNTFMSSSTHSFQVFLFLPLHLTPATSTFLQANTKSSTLVRSRCPNHLNLPCLTTSATLYTQDYKSTLHFLSFSDTPHIHLTIIRSRLMQIFSLHRPSFSPICQHTLDTSSVYLSHYVVLMHPKLPPPHLLHQVCHPNSKTWEHIPTSHWVQSQPLSAKLIGHDFPSKHLLQWKSTLFNFPEIPLHLS